MKIRYSIVFSLVILLTQSPLYAQDMSIPDASPWAEVGREVGKTKFKLSYYSPSVRGRNIWGELVPYGEEWRTGANEGTFLDISDKSPYGDQIRFGDHSIPADNYRLTTVPGKEEWLVKLSTEDTSFTAKVEPEESKALQETMRFLIDAKNDSVAKITLQWANVSVPFQLIAPTREMVLKGMKRRFGSWYHLSKAAKYLVMNNMDLKQAEEWAKQSVANKEDHFYNRWILAHVHAEKGDYKKAISSAEKALEVGKEESGFFQAYKPYIKADIEKWKKDKPSEFPW